jgi:hypothetical protein
MNQADTVRRAPVLQDGLLAAERNFKLALRLIMRDGIVVHKTFCSAALSEILRECHAMAKIS